MRSVYDRYDPRKDGNIAYAEFVSLIRENMSDKRYDPLLFVESLLWETHSNSLIKIIRDNYQLISWSKPTTPITTLESGLDKRPLSKFLMSSPMQYLKDLMMAIQLMRMSSSIIMQMLMQHFLKKKRNTFKMYFIY